MKKIFIFLLVIFIIIAVIYTYQQKSYSLEEVIDLVNSNNVLPENIHIEKITYANEEEIANFNVYVKDNWIYSVQNDSNDNCAESLTNILTHEEILIIHSDKKIFSHKNDTVKTSLIPSINSNKNAIYKFYGKEAIDGKKCIKFSLTSEYADKIEMDYYYIELENNHIIKHEFYDGSKIDELENKYTETYTYNFNTVTDDDILEFNKDNYPDYQYSE